MEKKQKLGSKQKKWIDALRSGNYKQGQADLHNSLENTYCCLGVAQELFDLHRKGNSEYTSPKQTEEVLGLEYETQVSLATFNDSGKTFNQIASYLERWPNKYFKEVK